MPKFENVSPDGELVHGGVRVESGDLVEVDDERAERLREQPRNWREVIAPKPVKKAPVKPGAEAPVSE